MRATTTILAYVIAFAAVAFIAAGVWDLSTLRADTGEMLEPSDYTPGIQTIADGPCHAWPRPSPAPATGPRDKHCQTVLSPTRTFRDLV